ncbi:MAG: response regulator transcription factor [Vicinamibacterales bacterium]
MNGAEMTVCIVDDDLSVRRALARLLRVRRYRVETFGSAVEFLQHGVLDSACCVLLDVRMPGITGFDVYQRLRKARPDVGVIFMTGHADVDLAALVGRGGVPDLLVKPLSEEALVAAIERVHASVPPSLPAGHAG